MVHWMPSVGARSRQGCWQIAASPNALAAMRPAHRFQMSCVLCFTILKLQADCWFLFLPGTRTHCSAHFATRDSTQPESDLPSDLIYRVRECLEFCFVDEHSAGFLNADIQRRLK